MGESAELFHLLREEFGLAKFEPVRADEYNCPPGDSSVAVVAKESF
jgi:hypothetical protein